MWLKQDGGLFIKVGGSWEGKGKADQWQLPNYHSVPLCVAWLLSLKLLYVFKIVTGAPASSRPKGKRKNKKVCSPS